MSRYARFLGAILGSILISLPVASFARQGTPPLSRRAKAQALPAVKRLVVLPTDKRAELAADVRAGKPAPVRFAVPTAVQITPNNDGTWEDVAGGRLWRLRVVSDGATDLNFGFTECRLPEGATLHIASEDEDYFQGPYSARDNKAHGQLWTPIIPGSRAIIELFVPTGAGEPRLVLSQINRGYRDMFHRQKDLSAAKAGSCNIDTICSEAAPWRNEIRSVARYTVNGSSLCTGTLINNVSNDFKNYFLTADHCGISAGNAATVVVYWNYESPTCGQHSGGSLSQNQSGAIFRMAKSDVDVTLIELEDIPDSTFRVFYAGWDRSGVAPPGAVGIHHPRGDQKSISFADSTLTTVDSCFLPGISTHWQVVWNSGVTEPGSSGSGIWDPSTHYLVGTLTGGDASCDLPQGPDCYGKFSVAWNSGATAATRLRDWLDPANTTMSVPGRDPSLIPVINGAGSAIVSEGCMPATGAIDPGEAVTVSFSLENVGVSNALNVVATLLATNGVTLPASAQNYGALAAGGLAVTRSFAFVATGVCGSVITPTLQLQDGTNNLGQLSFAFRLGRLKVTFTQNFDSVPIPTLPADWVNAVTGGSSGWRTVSSAADSAPNSVFASDPSTVSDATLTSPMIPISTASAQLSFRHAFDTEAEFDGGVLEIAYNNGPFNDIIAAGGSFAAGGYNSTIFDDPQYQSAIIGRDAWSGDSDAFISTVVNLPLTAAGQNVRLRWRLASDTSVAGTGWNVDSISLSDGYACCQASLMPLEIVGTRQTNNSIVFSFNTVSGQTYVTEFKSAVTTNLTWTPLQTNSGNGAMRSVTNALAPGVNRFFRVKVQ
ncbi:MAG TPA: hypothetical protein VNT99_11200 [Methylomirabilota bacterium]|nr:hypothetical protein [Methylomirabilota bacterium]